MAALIKVDDADNGYTGGPKELERRGCVLNQKPTRVLQLTTSNPRSVSKAGHAEFASEAGCWLRTVRSKESLGRTYHRRRTHQEDENHREGSNGKPPWQTSDA